MPDTVVCTMCGSDVAPGLLSCPGCQRLVHGDRLKELAAIADQAERNGEIQQALVAWREVLELLPQGTLQSEQVDQKIAALGRVAGQQETAALHGVSGSTSSGWSIKSGAAGIGAAGLFLLKFKFVFFFLLTKIKFLLLGLTKASTFLSMLASFGLYWQLYGWKFGLGLVLSIYVHEMGHVFVLKRYGVRAGAPMFIPGFGALIRLKQAMNDVGQDARVGLAGPIWGLGAALSCALGSLVFESPALAATARLGAFINLFNLVPIWQLDGGRAFRALTRPQRWLAAAAVALVWAQTGEGLLVLLMLGATYRALKERGPSQPDRVVLALYAGLVVVLSALLLIPVGP